MKFALILLAFLSLAGCASTVTVKEIKVPIPVPCIDAAAVPSTPSLPLQHSGDNEDLLTYTKRALAEIEFRKGYEAELEAVIKACTK